jgi:hypothetical protein
MPKSTKGGGSAGARGSAAGTGVWVRIGRVPIVHSNAMAGGSLAWNRPRVNAWCVCFYYFFLDKKVIKKSRRFDAVDSDEPTCLLTNRRLGESFRSKGLRLETPLRTMRGHKRRCIFRCELVVYLVIIQWKNKALDHAFISKGGLCLEWSP